MGNSPAIALKLIVRYLRSLNILVGKIDEVVKLTQVCQTRLLGVLATWNFVCDHELCPLEKEIVGYPGEYSAIRVAKTMMYPYCHSSCLNSHKNQFPQIGK